MTKLELDYLITEKVIKASHTNGLKNRVLSIIKNGISNGREDFNKFEVLNAINAVRRTKFLVKETPTGPVNSGFKYRSVREILNNCAKRTYKLQILSGVLILHTY